jgi:hypothetical protein
MESPDSDLWFEYYLADRLKLGTVAELRRRMSSAEYVGWVVFVGMEAQREQLRRQLQEG